MASSTTKGHPPATAPGQPAPSSSFPSSSAAQLPEDESRRKNTDCVYFLASPLTCKKGSECEYRHSEYARVNHRDCWFWLNGNCLNPKCSFRHPPLDTLLVPPVDSSAGSSVPDSSGAAAGSLLPPLHTVPSAPYVAAKPTVPCIFFQKGYCLKGDRCPFLHVPNPTSKKTPEFRAATVSGSSSLNNASGELKKCSQLKIVPQANVSRPIEVTASQSKTSVHAVKAMPRNGPFAEKCGTRSIISNEDLPKHRETTLHPHINGNARNKPGRAPQVSSLTAINKFGSALQASSLDEQRFPSGKEADDLLRESSPGFDVLVDDELSGADYYGNEDQFPRIEGCEGRNLNEFEIGHPDCYNSVDDVDSVMYRDRYGYDKYESKQEKRARDHHRTPSERSIIGGSHCDRRGVYNGVNPDRKENSDLRHRLSKLRRINGLSSVVSPDYASDGLAEEHGYRSIQGDSHQALPCASSFSSRLQGRIKLPRQSSPVNPPSMRSERENDKGRNRLRLSPSRPQLQSHQGKLHDRLRGRVQDNIGRDATARRDLSDYESSDFVAPKSLAELKKAKQSHSHSREPLKRGEEFTSVGKRKALESSQHTEEDLSFEGPKPLSEILKRKRKAEATDSQNGAIYGIEEEKKNSEHEEIAAVEKQETNQEDSKLSKGPIIAPKQEANLPTHVSVKNPGAAGESGAEGLDLNDKTILAETEASLANNELEGEEEGLATDGVEDHELEQYYEEGDESYEEEQDDGGEAYDEGEGDGMPDDHMDEDDGDNFAKKIGVLFG